MFLKLPLGMKSNPQGQFYEVVFIKDITHNKNIKTTFVIFLRCLFPRARLLYYLPNFLT